MGDQRRKGRSAATEGGRSPTGVVAGGERGRWSTGRKTEVVLRLLRGEDIDGLSRELGVTAAKIAEWRDRFLDGGQANLKTRCEFRKLWRPDSGNFGVHEVGQGPGKF